MRKVAFFAVEALAGGGEVATHLGTEREEGSKEKKRETRDRRRTSFGTEFLMK